MAPLGRKKRTNQELMEKITKEQMQISVFQQLTQETYKHGT